MPIAQVAGVAARAVVKYAPQVVDKAVELAKKATNGKVQSPQDVTGFVGSSPQRLSLVAGAFARAGVAVDDLVPTDIAGTNAQLAQIRQTLLQTAGNMQSRFDAGSDNSLPEGLDGDLIRKERVRTVLRVYGSENAYFLCHPNGGVPRSDFAWYAGLFGRR